MYAEMTVALREAEENSDIKLFCLTGNGDYFTSGNDLNNYLKNTEDDFEKVLDNGCKMVE